MYVCIHKYIHINIYTDDIYVVVWYVYVYYTQRCWLPLKRQCLTGPPGGGYVSTQSSNEI